MFPRHAMVRSALANVVGPNSAIELAIDSSANNKKRLCSIHVKRVNVD